MELGELGEAQAVTDRLRDLAEEQEHPWGLAAAKRCAAVLRLAPATRAAALAQAADAYRASSACAATPPIPCSRSAAGCGGTGNGAPRAMRSSGRRPRSTRSARPAGRSEARSELARVGARRPTPSGELTPAERRVVELAADGSSNKEIALALFVTVRTVEAHLTHAYAKLGVRSRAQLASRLGAIQ